MRVDAADPPLAAGMPHGHAQRDPAEATRAPMASAQGTAPDGTDTAPARRTHAMAARPAGQRAAQKNDAPTTVIRRPDIESAEDRPTGGNVIEPEVSATRRSPRILGRKDLPAQCARNDIAGSPTRIRRRRGPKHEMPLAKQTRPRSRPLPDPAIRPPEDKDQAPECRHAAPTDRRWARQTRGTRSRTAKVDAPTSDPESDKDRTREPAGDRGLRNGRGCRQPHRRPPPHPAAQMATPTQASRGQQEEEDAEARAGRVAKLGVGTMAGKLESAPGRRANPQWTRPGDRRPTPSRLQDNLTGMRPKPEIRLNERTEESGAVMLAAKAEIAMGCRGAARRRRDTSARPRTALP